MKKNNLPKLNININPLKNVNFEQFRNNQIGGFIALGVIGVGFLGCLADKIYKLPTQNK